MFHWFSGTVLVMVMVRRALSRTTKCLCLPRAVSACLPARFVCALNCLVGFQRLHTRAMSPESHFACVFCGWLIFVGRVCTCVVCLLWHQDHDESVFQDSPLANLFHIFIMFTVGWMPGTPCRHDILVSDRVIASPFFYRAIERSGVIVCVCFSGYLIFNTSGPAKYVGKNANHFSPSSVIFSDDERPLVRQTLAAFALVLGLLTYCIATFGTGLVDPAPG